MFSFRIFHFSLTNKENLSNKDSFDLFHFGKNGKKSSLFKTINMFSFSIFQFWIFMNVWNEFIILIFFPDCTIFSSRMTTFEIRFFPEI